MTAVKIHVFYTDAANGWCGMLLDSDENQVGEAVYSYRKSDAIAYAKQDGLPIHIFGKNGLFQRTA